MNSLRKETRQPRRPRGQRRAVVATTSMLLAFATLAACGDDDESTTATTSAEAATTTAGAASSAPTTTGSTESTAGATTTASSSGPATGEPIKVFQIVTIENPNLTFPEIRESLAASVEALNAAGGINGRPLEIQVCDDRGDPNQATQCAQEAVSSDAVAVLGQFTLQGPAVMPVLEAGNMASIGLNRIQPIDGSSPIAFPLDAGTISSYVAQAAFAAQQVQAQTVDVLYSDTASLSANKALMAQGAEQAGIEINREIVIPANTPDVSPYISQIQGDNPDAILSATSDVDQIKVWQTMSSQSVDIPLFNSIGALTGRALEAAGPAANGTYGVSAYPDPNGTAPGTDQLRADMEEYAPDLLLAGNTMRPWAAIQLFKLVASEMNDADITREGILAAFNAIDGVSFAWYENLSFTQPGPIADQPRIVVTNGYLSQVEDGMLVGVSNEPVAVG